MLTVRSNDPKKIVVAVVPDARDDARYQCLEQFIKRQLHRGEVLMEVLHQAQNLFGYLADDVLLFVARSLKLPPSRVYGVATFYPHFRLAPPGRHTCIVCTGTSCFLKGADCVLRAVRQLTALAPGQTTPDGNVSLLTARCLGACSHGPAAVYDGAVAARQTPETVRLHIQSWIEPPAPLAA